MATFTLSVTDDAYVYTGGPTQNLGSNSALNIAYTGGSARVYMRAPSFTVPAGEVVTSATLRIWAGSGATNVPVAFYKVTSAWSESGVTWERQPSFEYVKTITKTVSTGATVNEFDITNAFDAEHGLMMTADPLRVSVAFRSAEYGTASQRPQIIIETAPGVITPPPFRGWGIPAL
ncbi:DNRLRE domain-containing protein [Nocardioides abyssi]|uniref:DNRLRE domain-containing protein n=1 Tax=Nocardioides abyssi TaxID=3058370 RepID=UPI0034DFB4E6